MRYALDVVRYAGPKLAREKSSWNWYFNGGSELALDAAEPTDSARPAPEALSVGARSATGSRAGAELPPPIFGPALLRAKLPARRAAPPGGSEGKQQLASKARPHALFRIAGARMHTAGCYTDHAERAARPGRI